VLTERHFNDPDNATASIKTRAAPPPNPDAPEAFLSPNAKRRTTFCEQALRALLVRLQPSVKQRAISKKGKARTDTGRKNEVRQPPAARTARRVQWM
jgi:hypothetical protein